MYTTTAATKQAKYWAKKYTGTCFQGNFLKIAKAKVTAGFRWPPVNKENVRSRYTV